MRYLFNVMDKREIEIVVVSDVHLGTYGCHAMELNIYLNSIKPKILVLNGDIIDFWQFSKSYFPDSHIRIITTILKLIENGTTVYYITGNHDEKLRSFTNLHLDKLILTDKLIMNVDGKSMWFFHGDIFDFTMKHAKWLAKVGGKGYDALIVFNRIVNYISMKIGRGRISLSKKIKDGVKSAVSFISDFEETVIELALEQNFDYVLCGHIHSPVIKNIKREGRELVYLNSGDWIENLTALEYKDKIWRIFRFHDEVEQTNTPQKANRQKEVKKELETIQLNSNKF